MVHYRSYDHVEHIGRDEVENIDIGKCYIFPKLDGTNAVIFLDDDGNVCAGSRNRKITIENDNHGFAALVKNSEKELITFLSEFPNIILYGEFLKKHTLGTYRPEAWNRFYLFDIFDVKEGKYIPFSEWESMWMDHPWKQPEWFQILLPLCIINSPSQEQLQTQVETNTYLIQDGAGVGEGICIKNYEWFNKYGRQQWAKIVRNEFKEKNMLAFGITEKNGPKIIELLVAQQFCTPELVGKTRAKIVADVANENKLDLSEPNMQQIVESRFRGKIIPQLLGRVYHDLVVEDIWTILKKHSNPTINFGLLNRHVVAKVKEYSQDLF